MLTEKPVPPNPYGRRGLSSTETRVFKLFHSFLPLPFPSPDNFFLLYPLSLVYPWFSHHLFTLWSALKHPAMEAIKTPLSAAFSALWSKASSSTAKAFLPGEDTALTAGMESKFPSSAEKCELRIEGMTCGACVEVGILQSWLTNPQSALNHFRYGRP